jgi:rhamnosyltransferase subunit B
MLAHYQPYEDLFDLGQVVVHSGGIGALGLALRAGRASLMVPSAWDQHDNARRACRAGVAHALPAQAYRGPRVAQALRALLADPAVHARVATVQAQVAAEDGAGTAARLITALSG